ncbi:PKD domain-containing protein [Bizionia paragorgiae]|uniref:PKD domain-containing protein n=1 Tax=Bizionia paragorgiae TaxID=283786 RepID=A0A1H3XMQ0_BIZPA|nr:PKD domain-containing protein [Bizionia paragorgiae]SEA00201.1 PKD domain-containing protein [Bizionia paragorgiae]
MSTQQTISKHLDKSVIWLFVIVFLISASVFAYRYKNYKTCEDVAFTVKAKEFRVGELIKFTDNTDQAANWEWDFGDSTDVKTNKEVLHIFNKEGEYKVRLLVNNICQDEKTVTIKEKLFIIDSTKLPVFNVKSSIVVGETLNVEDKTNNASTWEWRFGETTRVNSVEKRASYVYKTPGLKTISLVVNGDVKHTTTKQINVLPIEKKEERISEITGTNRRLGDGIKARPLGYEDKDKEKTKDEPSDKPKVVPFIGDSQFISKLELVSNNKLDANAFKEYFCGDINKNIIVNGKNTSFLIFCEKIKNKKLRIKDITIYREKGSNCINTVTISQNKILGIF